MDELTCDTEELSNDRLERLILKEEIDGTSYLVQAKDSSIITGSGGANNVQVDLSADNPLPDGLKADFEEMFRPRFGQMLNKMEGVQQMDCHFQYVAADDSAFAMHDPLTFLEGVSVAVDGGRTIDMAMVEVADIASALQIDTPQLWMPPPAGFIMALQNSNEARLEQWKQTMKGAPTRYGRVDHSNTIVAMLGSYRNEQEQELKWIL